ncbi:MAG: hypothetical protein ACP6IS_00035 [Candidatus Asgardarchaeia archaeon]
MTKSLKANKTESLPVFACPICGRQIRDYFIDVPWLLKLYKRKRSPIPVFVKCPVGHSLAVYLYFENDKVKVAQVDQAFYSLPYSVIEKQITIPKLNASNFKSVNLFWHRVDRNILLFVSSSNPTFNSFVQSIYISLYNLEMDKFKAYFSLKSNIFCYFSLLATDKYSLGLSLCLEGKKDDLLNFLKERAIEALTERLFISLRRVRGVKTAEKKILSLVNEIINGPAGI